jgi:BirA family biotin operon repressor/biotin-[acetyl-CoA-carboxylase] ligase
MIDDLTRWADALEETIAAERLARFDRAYVLSVTGSTQDAARRLCASRPGAVVVAGRQTAGRGRMGHVWEHAADLGVAATFAVPCADFTPGQLALAAGVATARAAEALLGALAGPVRLGLRWPNDLIEMEGRRKLSGVLVEINEPVAFIGIGLNVLHADGDWSPALDGKAVSLRSLGSAATRLECVRRLMVELDRALELALADLVREWSQRDALLGRRAEFEHAGARYSGTVQSVSPLHEIVVESEDGAFRSLPAQATTLLQW